MVRALCGAASALGTGQPLLGVRPARAGLLAPVLPLLAALLGSPGALAAEERSSPARPAPQAAGAAARSASPAEGSGERQAGEATRLALERAQLDNGLRVVLHRDRSLPTVALGVAYAVGTRHEGPDEQGFARWLQRAMASGSRNVAAGEHDRLLREHGSSHSAHTSADRTLFVTVLPAHALPLGLWLEADRMKSLELSDTELSWQHRLLELELERESRDLSARGRRALGALVFQAPPGPGPASALSPTAPSPAALAAAAAPEAGMEQLASALRAFHRRHYAPNNAVLALSGSFEPAEALDLVRAHFGGAQSVDLAPVLEAEPAEQTRPRRSTLPPPDGGGPALWEGWQVPGSEAPEHGALELARLILGGGVGSRLHQLLVSEKGLARSVSTWVEGGRGPQLFGVEVQLREGADPAQASQLVQAEIAALGRFGPSATELQRAQRLRESQGWLELDGNAARVRALADAELFARPLPDDGEGAPKVSREDVQRAVARHLRPSRRSDVLQRARQR